MASNSIFDSFSTYSSTFLRGEYRSFLLSFKAGSTIVCYSRELKLTASFNNPVGTSSVGC
uniref:Uncharacterized protein n=1 Tax=Salvator merianae TaxID=96440 RepID=A0A8D0B2I9_SALMN